MRFLVIGLGSMGKRRVRNLIENGEQDIVGFDVSEDRRKETEEKHDIKTVGDLAELSSDSYDVIIISTPPNKHGDYIRKALKEEKHFFVEVTVTDDGYADVAATSNEKNRVRAPSCTYRFYAPIREMKRLVDEGRIGKLLSYQHHMGQYLPDWHPWEDYRHVYFAKKETGAVREMFQFEQNWLSWLVDAPIETVEGFIGKISDLDMEADDFLSAATRHKNGVVGNTMIDVISRKPTRRVRLIGSEGIVEWELGDDHLRVFDTDRKEYEEVPFKKGTPVEGYVTSEDMYVEEMAAFLRAVRWEGSWLYSFEEDLANLRALYDLEKTSKTKA
jgi:predicted dehydrogenase